MQRIIFGKFSWEIDEDFESSPENKLDVENVHITKVMEAATYTAPSFSLTDWVRRQKSGRE